MALALLGGCTVKTTVEVTATTPGNVTHLYVTVKEIWFTTHASAIPGDGKWKKKVLEDPVTIDLATLNGGASVAIGSLDLGAGKYDQVRLVLADIDQALAESAEDLNLAWNNALQFTENGLSRLVPLEFASPGASLLIPASIDIEGNTLLDELSSSDEPAATVVVDVDALRSLAIFTHGGEIRSLLDPGLAAYNDADVGAITGTFDLSAIATSAINSRQGIVVSAERVEPGALRRSVVKSVRLGSGGSFTLYPLPLDDEGNGTFDIVVHGPGVSTVIVTGVEIEDGETATLQSSAITVPVADSFLVNTTAAVHGGTRARFYQSLPLDPRPFEVDFAAVHPFDGGFNNSLALSEAGLVHGAWNDGEVISFASATAGEGAATYRLAGDSRWRASSGFTSVTSAGLGPVMPQDVDVPQPGLPAGASAATISGTVHFTVPDQFDSLLLVVSRGGQIVEVVDLGATLPGSSFVDFTVSDVPGGRSSAVYDVWVRAWHSSDVEGTLVRALFTPWADLRTGNVSGLSLQL